MDITDIAYKGGQYFDYGSEPYYSPWMTQDATPKIVDALLMRIVRLGL
jgi:hypothetical protein